MDQTSHSIYDINNKFKVHMISSGPETFLTNAYIVESDNSLVVIDTLMTVSDAKSLKAQINLINKPLAAVFVTHAHPDHYNGTSIITDGVDGVPIISTKNIIDSIDSTVDSKELKWRPYFGDEWPSNPVPPNQIVSNLDSLEFDGINYEIYELGPAESNNDMYILVDKPSVVFVGDVVFNNVHSFMNDGNSFQWIKVLDNLLDRLSDIDLLFTGHGKPGKPVNLIKNQKNYLEFYQQCIRSLMNADGSISQTQKEELVQLMVKYLDTDSLIDFISSGADAVATEIYHSLVPVSISEDVS